MTSKKSDTKKVFEKNKEYTVEITDISSEGNGIAHIDGYTVFVEGAVIGDIAKILAVKSNTSFGFGKLLEIITPSPIRTEPKCPHFQKCGGCQIMCMNYEKQLEWKRDIVKNNLERIGGFSDVQVSDTIGMDNPYRYRNKAVFPVGNSTPYNDDIVCGFYAPRSHRIIPMNDCIISGEYNGSIIDTVLEYMKAYNVTAYDENTNTGVIRRIFTRKGTQSGEIMVVISATVTTLPHSDILVNNLLTACPSISSIILNVNTKKTNLVLGDKNITLYGKSFINDTLLGVSYEISPNSFYQINYSQTEKLYSKAIEFAALTGNENVMDIYCGIGTISLCCAKKAKSVTGIEIVERAIKDAKSNATANGITNAEFYAGSAEDIVPSLIENGAKPDVVIIDPPRKGSDESTLSAIIKAQPERIVYVSCNSATLARDARFLSQHGYELKIAVPVDMFPHTVHVETVVLMSRVNTNK